jgi:hypothetical protein
MDLHVHLEAPIIVIPAKDSMSVETLCVFVDLGTLRLDSVLQDSSGDLVKKTAEEIDRLAYDVSEITLEGMQVLLGRRVDRKDYSILKQSSSPKHLLNKMDVRLTLQQCLQECVAARLRLLPTRTCIAVGPDWNVVCTGVVCSLRVTSSESKQLQLTTQSRYHTELAGMKVAGELPSVQVVISSMQIKNLEPLGSPRLKRSLGSLLWRMSITTHSRHRVKW